MMKPSRTTTAGSALIAVLICLVAATHASDWDITVVDPTGDAGNNGISLKLLPGGIPAIAYWRNNRLIYASFNGTTWDITDVAAAADDAVSLAVSGDQPSIGFYGGAADLMYSVHGVSGWHTTQVDTVGLVGRHCSLAYLPSGDPAISYYDETSRNLKYARFDGEVWQIAPVDTVGDVGTHTSLAILPSQQPAISYCDETNRNLKYAWFDGAEWNTMTVDDVGLTGRETSLAVVNSQPAIGYQGPDNTLKYAWFDGSAWQSVVVDGEPDAGWSTSLAVLASGWPVISHWKPGADLRFSWFDGTTWHTASVDNSGSEGAGENSSLVILPGGRAAIAYRDVTSRAVKHAVLSADCNNNGLPDAGEVAAGAAPDCNLNQVPDECDIASGHSQDRNANGIPDECESDCNENGIPDSLDITDGTSADCNGNNVPDECDVGPSAWQALLVESLSASADSCSVTALPSGYPALTYYDAGRRILAYAWYDGTEWHNTDVDTAGDVGQYNSLTVLPSGAPAVSYFDATNGYLKYARLDGGAWHVEVVDAALGVGAFSSLASLPSGWPAIAYLDATRGVLKYAHFDGSTWQTADVLGGGLGCYSGLYASLAILPSGQPAIACVVTCVTNPLTWQVAYAWFDGTHWLSSALDSGTSVLTHTSLAVLGTGQPAIVYANDAGSVLYAVSDGSTWQISPLASNATYPALTTLPSGAPAVSYVGLTRGTADALKYAWLAGGQWNERTAGAAVPVVLGPDLAILPGGVPTIACYAGSPRSFHVQCVIGSAATSPDCNANRVPDECDVSSGTSPDCNHNNVPDVCDIAAGTSLDLNSNGIPDECDPDCNGNHAPDDWDISTGVSQDCNHSGIPDECEADGDGDGTIDACDECPSDPRKSAHGACGCGALDTDSDGDGVADCVDGCPNDFAKSAPGACGCGSPDSDRDNDGTPDCQDACPDDRWKVAPGVCGCGTLDVDTDGDTVPDCFDACPNDPAKTIPGPCGCGQPETDSDGDGVPDCIDNCPAVANSAQTDTDGDGVGDACDEDQGEKPRSSLDSSFMRGLLSLIGGRDTSTSSNDVDYFLAVMDLAGQVLRPPPSDTSTDQATDTGEPAGSTTGDQGTGDSQPAGDSGTTTGDTTSDTGADAGRTDPEDTAADPTRATGLCPTISLVMLTVALAGLGRTRRPAARP